MTEVSILDPAALSQRFESADPDTILRWALARYDHIALSFSGAEDGILIDMACKIQPDITATSDLHSRQSQKP